MFNTSQNNKMVEVLSGPERRRRRTPQEKIAIIQQTMEPGMTVSHVARLHGINANQIFKWRKQYENGSLTAVASGEEVVPASELAAANKQIRELQRLLGKKTMEAEILKEAVELGRAKKWIAHAPLLPGDLLLERKPADPCRKRAHKGRVAVAESNRRWCSDGFEFRCDNGEKLRVTFAQDCCHREIIDWAASTGGYDKETVQDVMLGAVEKRFGRQLPTESLEWLTDNGSAYRTHETRAFARLLGLEPCTTAVRSPESNGIAESFVKTIKRDYISLMPKPDSQAAVMNLAVAFSHYNEHHPHSALGYRSPREYIRRKLSQP